MLARLVSLVTSVVTAIIVVGILLVVFEANKSNDLVNAVLDAARWLVGPFKDVFKPDGLKARIVLNWGLAVIVYGLVGGVVVRLLSRR
jgi:predicted cobalt transporter CbtA